MALQHISKLRTGLKITRKEWLLTKKKNGKKKVMIVYENDLTRDNFINLGSKLALISRC